MDNVAICNLALGRIGVDKVIASLSENSKEARSCARVFDHVRDLVLAEAAWPFAVRTGALAAVAEAGKLGGWGYQFARPVDALRMLDVVPSSEVETAAGYYLGTDQPWVPFRSPLYAFRQGLSADGNGTVVLSNVPSPYAVYVARITNPETFPTLFVEALADRLAMEISTPMSADPRWTELAAQRYERSFRIGASSEYEQAEHGPDPVPPSIRARW